VTDSHGDLVLREVAVLAEREPQRDAGVEHGEAPRQQDPDDHRGDEQHDRGAGSSGDVAEQREREHRSWPPVQRLRLPDVDHVVHTTSIGSSVRALHRLYPFGHAEGSLFTSSWRGPDGFRAEVTGS
jgi:hypothetical protein